MLCSLFPTCRVLVGANFKARLYLSFCSGENQAALHYVSTQYRPYATGMCNVNDWSCDIYAIPGACLIYETLQREENGGLELAWSR